MKKSYVKPEVTLVRFELSEAIASCVTKLYNNHSSETDCGLSDDMEKLMGIWGNVNITDDKQCSAPLKGYCYYTSANMLMNS